MMRREKSRRRKQWQRQKRVERESGYIDAKENKSGFIENEATQVFHNRSETGDKVFENDKEFCLLR